KLSDVVGRLDGQPLPEATGLALLHRAGVPAVRGITCVTPAQAIARVGAAGLAFPLVAKVDSPDVPHKSDVGGVELGILSASELPEALRMLDARVAAHRPDARRRGFLVQET